MKKITFFLIVGALVAAVDVPAIAAAYKCVKPLEYNGYNSANYNCSLAMPHYASIDWGVTCSNVGGVSVRMTGVGVLAHSSAHYPNGAPRSEIEFSTDVSEQSSCWCRMFTPAVSQWVCIGVSASAADCGKRCAEQMASDTPLRDLIFEGILS